MRLFESRSLLEDLAIIARLKRFGVLGIHERAPRVASAHLESICGGGALRLVQLDALDVETVDEAPHLLALIAHIKTLEQVFEDIEFLEVSVERQLELGAVLERICVRLPAVVASLQLLKNPPIIDHASASELDLLVRKYQIMLPRLGDVADAVRVGRGVSHGQIERLERGALAMQQLLEQQALFAPKPFYNQEAYDGWVTDLDDAKFRVRETLQRLLDERLRQAAS